MGWADGKHALITGGGSGIGAAVATALAEQGARVSLLGRWQQPLQAVADRVNGRAFTCDVTDRTSQEQAFAAARAAFGPVDYLILNAGVGDSAPFARTSRESWNRIIATNLTALFDGAQLGLPDLLKGPGKRMVIVASVAGLRGAAYAAPYVASKHGAVGLARSLALEFAKSGLTVNAVCPAFVDTPMVDDSAARIARTTRRSEQESRQALAAMNANGRLVTAEEVAHAVLYLCHPDAAAVTGACLTVDGGTTA